MRILFAMSAPQAPRPASMPQELAGGLMNIFPAKVDRRWRLSSATRSATTDDVARPSRLSERTHDEQRLRPGTAYGRSRVSYGLSPSPLFSKRAFTPDSMTKSGMASDNPARTPDANRAIRSVAQTALLTV